MTAQTIKRKTTAPTIIAIRAPSEMSSPKKSRIEPSSSVAEGVVVISVTVVKFAEVEPVVKAVVKSAEVESVVKSAEVEPVVKSTEVEPVVITARAGGNKSVVR